MFAVALAALMAAGCARNGGPPKTIVRITPAGVSTAELKRLDRQPGMQPKRFTLEREGSAMGAAFTIEHWANGVCVSRSEASSPGDPVPDDLSISAKNILRAKGNEMCLVDVAGRVAVRQTDWLFGMIPWRSTSTRHYSHGFGFDVPQLLKEQNVASTRSVNEPIQLTKDQPVAIWAYVAGRGAGTIGSSETIDATVARVEWALVVRFGLR